MRDIVKALSLLAVCAALIGCGNPKPALVAPQVLAKHDLQYYWQIQAPLECGETVQRLYRLDENLYLLTSRNRLVAIDAMRGLLKWSREVAAPTERVYRPVHIDKLAIRECVPGVGEILGDVNKEPLVPFDAVLINTLSRVMVMDRSTGKLYRNIPLDFAANSSGSTDGSSFYVGSSRGHYSAIRINEALHRWTLSTGEMITAGVEYFSGRVYVGSLNGTMRSAMVDGVGKLAWTQCTNGPISADFVVDSRGVFMANEDNRIYAFDTFSGRLLWEQPVVMQGPARTPIQVGENTLFQVAQGEALYAVDLAKGAIRWKNPCAREVMALMDGMAYLRDKGDYLVMVNEMTGKESGRLPMSGFDVFLPNTKASALYASSADGRVACIRKISAGYLTPELLKAKPAEAPAAAPVVPAAPVAPKAPEAPVAGQ